MAAPRLFKALYWPCLSSPIKRQTQCTTRRIAPICARRGRDYSHSSAPPRSIPDFAFAFEFVPPSRQLPNQSLTLNSIDGVLLRSHDPIPRAHEALALLQQQMIPFILLTNGGGKTEAERVDDLQERLRVPLDTSMFVQSHTPFADLQQYKDKTILVLGGEQDKCRLVAEK